MRFILINTYPLNAVTETKFDVGFSRVLEGQWHEIVQEGRETGQDCVKQSGWRQVAPG